MDLDAKFKAELHKLYSGIFTKKKELDRALHEARLIMDRKEPGEVELYRASALLAKTVRTLNSWKSWEADKRRESAYKKGLWSRPKWTAVGKCVWLPGGAAFTCETPEYAKFAVERHNERTAPK
jgi:hypothetical protein